MSTVRRYISRPRSRGHAAVEIALMSPWIFLLFMAIFDFGFYAYTAISVENAARVAAMYTSADNAVADDSYFACYHAVQELRMVLNVGSSVSCPTTCSASPGAPCSAGPITVRARRLNGQSGVPFGVDGAPATEVTVTYNGFQLFTLPFMMGKFDLTRVVQMRI